MWTKIINFIGEIRKSISAVFDEYLKFILFDNFYH